MLIPEAEAVEAQPSPADIGDSYLRYAFEIYRVLDRLADDGGHDPLAELKAAALG